MKQKEDLQEEEGDVTIISPTDPLNRESQHERQKTSKGISKEGTGALVFADISALMPRSARYVIDIEEVRDQLLL